MKQYNKVFIGLFVFLQLVSCKKSFLDVPLTDVIVSDVYVVNLTTAEEVLNGVYIKLSRDFYNGVYALYPDLIADNIKPRVGVFLTHYSWVQTPDQTTSDINNINQWWMYGYNIIRDCNYLIGKIDQFRAEDEVKADNIKGQAYSIRALIHHALVNTFAQPYSFSVDASHIGIPYVLDFDPTAPVSRQTVAEVYSNIVTDLTMGIQLMSPLSTNKALISQKAAKALLARVYLFKGDYSDAKDLARDVAMSIPIMSSPAYPSQLFTKNDTESLLWFPPSQSPYATDFQGRSFTKNFIATMDIKNLLYENPNDARKNWLSVSSGSWFITKFPQGVIPGFTTPAKSYYHTVIRSSEMYLTAAEAYAKLGGQNNEDSARFFLDAIRKRADKNTSNSSAAGGALIDSIYKERRKELCFEGLRMFDLLRLGKGVNRVDYISPAAPILPYPSNKAVAPLPIIDVLKYPLAQNEGY